MAYSHDFIDRVREASDIVSVVEQYIPLKKAGVNFTALCPFHSEKTPSFYVSPQKQIYHCFGCNAGGNVFNFVMEMEKVPFPEAVKMLAEKAGIPVPVSKTSQQDKRKEYLYSVMSKVSNFYRKKLKSSSLAKGYLARRGISEETIEEFGIGYSPDAASMISFAKSEDVEIGTLKELGLVIEKNGRVVDKFRGRIIFPIQDIKNRVVAFGGRTVSDSPVKYLNSPETFLFHKSRILYSMNRAKPHIIDAGSVMITEGYVDVATLWQFGFRNVCGVLGTALTESHIYQMKRFTGTIYLLFDSDSAGINAALRSAEKILSFDLQAFVVWLGVAKDADEFLRKFGGKNLREKIRQAYPLMDFVRGILKKRHQKDKSVWKAKFIGDIAPVVLSISNAVLREDEIKKTAEFLGVSRRSVEEEIEKSRKGIFPRAAEEPRKISPREKIEREIISFLVNYPEMVDKFEKDISPADLSFFGDVLEKIYGYFNEGGKIEISRIITLIPQTGENYDAVKDIVRAAVEKGDDRQLDKQKIQARKKEAAELIGAFKILRRREEFDALKKKINEGKNLSRETLDRFMAAARQLKGGEK
ncbi:MAG: DNA primase [Elusimicrobia bacterium]|nr:DNA primase [Elusimicrobiota bacterium]